MLILLLSLLDACPDLHLVPRVLSRLPLLELVQALDVALQDVLVLDRLTEHLLLVIGRHACNHGDALVCRAGWRLLPRHVDAVAQLLHEVSRLVELRLLLLHLAVDLRNVRVEDLLLFLQETLRLLLLLII